MISITLLHVTSMSLGEKPPLLLKDWPGVPRFFFFFFFLKFFRILTYSFLFYWCFNTMKVGRMKNEKRIKMEDRKVKIKRVK